MSDKRDYENTFVVDRLKNQLISAEGSSLPPRQKGEFRVPFVTGLRVARTESFLSDSTRFTLVWDEPQESSSPIAHYNVYALSQESRHTAPQGPFAANKSPSVVVIKTVVETQILFIVQTQLVNGMTSEIQFSPTCTGVTFAHV